mmetsp:Transcript_2600/g.3992  ORF Transcript_2600/g.3992 Transcript_2600/m.3992 type:complete len:363 (+) Transcript_2600:39-1127(+)|eukprot:CAMPEP_0195511340 /NCGR_PEP_ID=MMETSP0794_2-20130614/3695_1 /TAXON_ID=515487 /ORGANISM="Stephanopyxis turris, Strain CCMP 815" /LENGTH=362 /DNA_ID=CAMNT_0040638917 /DNA_START=39 /DNA_END=1127 /DNA_ORIENTATION=+
MPKLRNQDEEKKNMLEVTSGTYSTAIIWSKAQQTTTAAETTRKRLSPQRSGGSSENSRKRISPQHGEHSDDDDNSTDDEEEDDTTKGSVQFPRERKLYTSTYFYFLCWSETLFFMGSLFYTCLSFMELRDAYDEAGDGDGDYDYDYDYEEEDDNYELSYKIIYALAAGSFLLSGIVDWTWARSLHSKHEKEVSTKVCSTMQTPSMEEIVAIFLSTAGFIDLIGAILLFHDNEPLSSVMSLIACHFYLFEACAAMLERKLLGYSLAFFALARTLSGMGDALFLIGSLIDVGIAYCGLVPGWADTVGMAWWDVFSSVLWQIDSIFYIVVALRKCSARKKEELGFSRLDSFDSEDGVSLSSAAEL